MDDFAVSFFRRNGARKELLKHLTLQDDKTEDELAVWSESLVRDLMMSTETGTGTGKGGEARPIRLLDVGSCYNPVLNSPNAAAFEVTALDLEPAHPSVYQGDFLRVDITDGRAIQAIMGTAAVWCWMNRGA